MNRGASWDTIRSSSGTGLKLIMLNYINICYNPVKVRQQSTIVLLSVEYVPLIQHLGWVIINKNHTNLGLCCLFLWLSCQLLLKDCKASYSPAEWSCIGFAIEHPRFLSPPAGFVSQLGWIQILCLTCEKPTVSLMTLLTTLIFDFH